MTDFIKPAIFLVGTVAVAAYGLYLLFPAAFKPSGRPGGHKRWVYLFGVTLALEALAFVVAPLFQLWLPAAMSTYAFAIDLLFYIILAVTGVTFIGVSIVFVIALYKFPADPNRKSVYTHGNHTLELIWSGTPAVLLVFLGIGQVPAWLEVKNLTWLKENLEGSRTERFLQLEVTARQWEWRIRYPSTSRLIEWIDPAKANRDVRLRMPERPDDVRLVNEIHCVKGQKVLIHLKTQDVLHSLFLPQMRLKQDALPGKNIPVWFESLEANCVYKDGTWRDGVRRNEKGIWVKDQRYIWELACAEYCGARHSLMRGKLYVHDDQADFDRWLKTAEDAAKKVTADGK